MASNFHVTAEPFGDGRPDVLLYKLIHGEFQLWVTNFGAAVVSVFVPDASGKVADIALGFDTAQPYIENNSPYFGGIVGRVANRIGGAACTLDGVEYRLTANDGRNTLHGGKMGFNKRLWHAQEVSREDGPAVRFSYTSMDGEEGFPGAVSVSVTYSLRAEGREMWVEMEGGEATRATPLNLASHTYWNLKGFDSGDVLDHTIQIAASTYTPVDSECIPTGEILPVKDSPFDFSEARPIGARISEIPGEPGGYDHNYVLDGRPGERPPGGVEGLRLAAVVGEGGSGRVMELFTTAPGMQFYSGNFLDGTIAGKRGTTFVKHSGLCLETQGFPDSVNKPLFPSVILRPGQKYEHTMVTRFSTS